MTKRLVVLAAVLCGPGAHSFLPTFSPKHGKLEKKRSIHLATSTPSSTSSFALPRNVPKDPLTTEPSSYEKALEKLQNTFSTLVLAFALSLSLPNINPASSTAHLFTPAPVQAADYYGALTDEQKAVAEAWRVVDNSFLDRTFNGQDWFQLRQDAVKRRYKSPGEAQDAISDLVSKLGDKYTRYLSPSKYQSIVDSATGTLAGVGIEISTNSEGKIIASDVEANAPASKAGILPDDVFVEVDGNKFDSKSTPDDVALVLRGPPGSKVGVVMERQGKTLDYIITREPIKITAVKSYMADTKSNVGKVGVIRIKSFSGTTADTVKAAYLELQKKGAQAFVFDLRGNPGGLLPGGVDTASLFLDSNKPIVFVVNKKGTVDSQATFAPGIDLTSPLVVLVDDKTASAAEVFTAAMKENGRATVAGTQTFGKGIVQTVRELSNNYGGVAVTVARYETPLHNDINKQGIPVNVKTSVDCPKTNAMACLNPNMFTKPAE